MSKLATLLESQKEQITRDAVKGIGRASVSRYRGIDENQKTERISLLYQTVKSCIEKRDSSEILKFSRNLTKDRFGDGYQLHELNAVYSKLEEIIWRKITEWLDPSDYADVFSLVSTVFAHGKEVLADEYVALTAKAAPSGDLTMDFSSFYKDV